MMSFIYILILLFVIMFLLRLYCRLTVGKCHSLQNMAGKTVLITGASSGIGKATAVDLARRSARVILACRNLKKAERVRSEVVLATGNTNVEVKYLDLEFFDSVRECAEDVLKTENRLDVLINNAGAFCVVPEMTKDGCDKTMQANYLGHFLLTLLLLELMKKSKPSRIINVTSFSYVWAVFDFDDMAGIAQSFILRILGNYYSRTKLASVWFTTELARRLDGSGVTVNCLNPGFVDTKLQYAEHPTFYLVRFFMAFVGKSALEGAQTSVHLAVHPDLERETGKFFSDCHKGRLFGQALDKTSARKVFEMSEKMVGTTFQK